MALTLIEQDAKQPTVKLINNLTYLCRENALLVVGNC